MTQADQKTVEEINAFISARWPHLVCHVRSLGEACYWTVEVPPLLEIHVTLNPAGAFVELTTWKAWQTGGVTLARSPIDNHLTWEQAMDSVLPTLVRTATNLMPSYGETTR